MSGDRYATLVAQMRDLTHPLAAKQRNDLDRLSKLVLCVKDGKEAIETLIAERDDWKQLAQKADSRANKTESALRKIVEAKEIARILDQQWCAAATGMVRTARAVLAQIEKETGRD